MRGMSCDYPLLRQAQAPNTPPPLFVEVLPPEWAFAEALRFRLFRHQDCLATRLTVRL